MTGDVLDSGEAGGLAIRGSAWRTIAYAGALLMSLASVPFMIRHLGEVQYGYYVTASAIVFIIGGLTEAGLTNLGIREASVLPPAERERFLRNLLGLRLVLTATGVVLATAITWVTGAEDEIVAGVMITGVGLFVALTQQTYMVTLQADLRLGWVSALEFLKQFTLSALTVALVIAGAGLIAFYWAVVVSAAVMIVATILLLRGHAPLVPAFDGAAWRPMIRDTLPYAVAAAVGLVYFRIAVILLSYVSSDEETGIFSAAFRIVEVVGVIPWLLVSSAFPILARAARDDEARLGYALQRIFEIAIIAGGLIVVGLGVGADFAILVVAGDDFDASVSVLQLQAVGLVTTFLLATWQFGLLSLKLFRQLLYANLLAATLAITGTLVLAPPMGANGAALATILAEAALALACLVFLTRARPGLAPRLGVLPKALGAGALAILSALLLDLPSVVEAVLAGAVYVAMVLATRAVPPELFAALRRR